MILNYFNYVLLRSLIDFNSLKSHQKLLERVSFFALISTSVLSFMFLGDVYGNKAGWYLSVPFYRENFRNFFVLIEFPSHVYLK